MNVLANELRLLAGYGDVEKSINLSDISQRNIINWD